MGERKSKLARLLARAPAEIVLNEHTDEDGATVFGAPHPGLNYRMIVCGNVSTERLLSTFGPELSRVRRRAASIRRLTLGGARTR